MFGMDKKHTPTILIVGLAVPAGVALFVIAFGTLFLLERQARPKWSREQAREALRGKTRAEVKAALGKPDKAEGEPGGAGEEWRYLWRGLTYDPRTDKTDYALELTFGREGTVTRVKALN